MTVEKYFSETCGPCKMLAPVIDELAEEYQDVQFLSLDTALNEEKVREEGIRAVPTLIFKDEDGNEIERVVGLLPKAELAKKIEEHKG